MAAIISWYSRICHDRPYLVLGGHLLWIVMICAATMMTGQFDLQEGGGATWLINGERAVENFDSFNAAREWLPGAAEEDTLLVRTDDDWMSTTTIIYTSPSDNMITPEYLKVIKQVEETYFKTPGYSTYCKLAYSNASSLGCAPPFLSLLSPGVLIDYEWDGFNPGYPSLDDITQEYLDQRLAGILRDPNKLFNYGFHFDSSFGKNCSDLADPPAGCSGFNLKSKYTRSMLEVAGLPLDGFLDQQDKTSEMHDAIDVFMSSVDSALFELLGMSAGFMSTELVSTGKLEGVEVVWMNQYLDQRDFGKTINSDLSWAAASLLAVYCYMAFHTKSFFISAIGMANVIFSFVLAIFTTKLVFQVAYMDMMLVLIIFVTLGIGADDVFVFVDAFKQAEAVPAACGSLLSRLDYTMHRASKAVFITSLTTMIAFFMTSISDLVNIQAFGIYAGMNIFFLFCLTVLLLPPVVVIWENNFSHLPCCVCHSACLCCGDSRSKALSNREDKKNALSQRSTKDIASMALESATPENSMKMKHMQDEESGTQILAEGMVPPTETSTFVDAEGLGRVEQFFHSPYISFLQKTKYFIVIIFIGLAAAGVYFATLLAPPVETEAFLPDHHMTSKVQSFLAPTSEYWAASNQDITEYVWFVWGVDGMDTSKKSKWDAEDRGILEWDTAWKPYSRQAQELLLTVCPEVRAAKCDDDTVGCATSPVPNDDSRWLLRRTPDNPDGELDCWIEDMRSWLQAKGMDLPMEPSDFEAQLWEFYQYAESTRGVPSYRTQIGYTETAGSEDLTLRYLAFKFTSTFTAPQSEVVTSAVIRHWEDLIDQINANSQEEGMSRGFMTSAFPFVWVYTQRSLVSNALLGLGLVFAIAFVVINLATMNWIISIISTATIAGIVVTVLGVGAKGISGWEFGMAESIATVILIGFSMDYCLHISAAYIESESPLREGRIRDSLSHLGVSVVAGAITTVLSGLFLWGTVMIFFQKFAFLITFTVLMSFLWSVLFLPAVLLIIGPQHETGNWMALFRCCCASSPKNSVAPLS